MSSWNALLVCAVSFLFGMAEARENILVLITDDQDIVLGGFDHMPIVQELIQKEGTTFSGGGFVHSPSCCPSRSSILSGRYLHNNGVINNKASGNCYGAAWRADMERGNKTFPTIAKAAGYTTAYAGKYLNQYRGNNDPIPPGWDNWVGLVGNSGYYGYQMVKKTRGNNRARRIRKGRSYPRDYFPNVIKNHVLFWMNRLPEPWLIVAAYTTPHGPFQPAPWARDQLTNLRAPRTPNWNASEESNQQKHWFIRQLNPVSQSTQATVDGWYRARLQMLLSVDEHVREMTNRLRSNGQLNNTVFMYTSDNGYQFGQHRLSADKRHLYEQDTRVPFAVRGPGVLKDVEVKKIASNVDIAPTILDIMGVEQEAIDAMDGVSFWDYIRGLADKDDKFAKRKDFLIAYNGESGGRCGLSKCPFKWDIPLRNPDAGNNTYRCVRTFDYDDPANVQDDIYCRFIDDEQFVEYYDITSNPWQLGNDVGSLTNAEINAYESRIDELLNCEGPSCHVPPPSR